jgi:hypothetical protein
LLERLVHRTVLRRLPRSFLIYVITGTVSGY